MNRNPSLNWGIRGVLAVLSLTCVADFAAAADADPVRIVMIGDSHSAGTFGKTVDQALRTQLPLAEVNFYAASSATPNYFFYGTSSHGGFYQHTAKGKPMTNSPSVPEIATPKLGDTLDKTHANVTVVALGTNLLRANWDNPTVVADAAAQITRTIQTIKDKGSRCIWVGSPDERFVPRTMLVHLYELLTTKTTDMGCALIDSRKYTHYPDTGGDGIHYDSIVVTQPNGQRLYVGTQKATEWGQKVAAEIVRIIAGGVTPASSPAPAGSPGAE